MGEVRRTVRRPKPVSTTRYTVWCQRRGPAPRPLVPGNVAAWLAEAEGGSLRLPLVETIKGFGIWEEEPEVALAVFPNHAQGWPHAARPSRHGFPASSSVAAARRLGEGTADAALNHVELFE